MWYFVCRYNEQHKKNNKSHKFFFIMKYVIGFVFYTAQSAMNKYGNTDFLYMLMFYGYIKKICNCCDFRCHKDDLN